MPAPVRRRVRGCERRKRVVAVMAPGRVQADGGRGCVEGRGVVKGMRGREAMRAVRWRSWTTCV